MSLFSCLSFLSRPQRLDFCQTGCGRLTTPTATTTTTITTSSTPLQKTRMPRKKWERKWEGGAHTLTHTRKHTLSLTHTHTPRTHARFPRMKGSPARERKKTRPFFRGCRGLGSRFRPPTEKKCRWFFAKKKICRRRKTKWRRYKKKKRKIKGRFKLKNKTKTTLAAFDGAGSGVKKGHPRPLMAKLEREPIDW